jgi:hypothetical protein
MPVHPEERAINPPPPTAPIAWKSAPAEHGRLDEGQIQPGWLPGASAELA